ncbi:MAG: branched-chain amino acid ABC transporter permease [Proteobacteria bacterium]|nr:branched-chain amino acid ABC transporter permease [Pseudomonadota bacterium]
MNTARRYWIVFGLVAALILFTGLFQGWSIALSLITVGLISAVIALGLNIQWGYAGLFNAGVMGFSAIGAVACVLVSMPWVTSVMTQTLDVMLAYPGGNAAAIEKIQHDLPRRVAAERQILGAWLIGGAGAILAWAINRVLRARLSGGQRAVIAIVILGVSLVMFTSRLAPAIVVIESTGFADDSKYLGGLGLPIILAWVVGGLMASAAAWLIAKIALGLRSDYLAIATLGISEIVIAILKNEGWLTRGVLNVTGLPSPVPTAQALQSAPYELATDASLVVNKLLFVAIIAAFLIIFLWLAHRALRSPWGRMLRAIRDNEEAANAMGKDVVRRHRQVFILGSFLLGIGGAMMATNVLQFEPGGYQPLRYTFLIWVMVIVGGSGNNLGSVVGGLLIWFVWVQAEPIASWLFALLGSGLLGEDSQLAQTLLDRAPQMRTLVMGLLLLMVLRLTPRGILPEELQRK